jgi:hypothetical protein
LFWQERKDTTKTDSLAFTLLIANSILAYVFIQNASEASYVSSYAGLIVGAVHGVSAFILKRQANHNSTYVNLHLIISVIALNAYVAFEVQTSNVGWIFALETAILIGLANQFLSKSLMLVAFVVQLLAFVLTLAQMGYGQEGDNFPFFHSTAQYAWSSLVLLLTAYFLNKRVSQKLDDNWSQTLSFTLPIFSVLIILFLGIREITHYFDMRYFHETALSTINSFEIPIAITNERLLDYKSIWVIQFLFALWTVILLGKRYVSKDTTLGLNIVLTVFVLISTTISLIIGFWNLNTLRIEAFNYLSNPPEFFVPAFPPTWYDVQLRYYFLVVVAFLLFALYRFSTSAAMPRALAVIQRLFMHVVILWSLASEVIGWSVQFNSNPSYRFGLSVVLSMYSFFLIALGIRKAAKYLRFAGLTLFFITLLKLFAFDIWILNSLAKTIAFISLGLLMLLVSFLYGKYKTKLFGSEE